MPSGSAWLWRSRSVFLSIAGAGAALLPACGTPGPSNPSDVAGKYILALCDADMPASAMVDRQLGQRDPNDKDVATIIGLPISNGNETPFAQIGVSNSVMGPPQGVAVSADGRWAYVVETLGPAPEGASSSDQLPEGNKVTRLDLAVPTRPLEAGTVTVGTHPMSVDISPDGGYLAVVSREKRQQIQIIPVSEGGMGEPASFPLMGLDDDENTEPSCVSWHPSGNFIAVTIPKQNLVAFYRVSKESGAIKVEGWGAPISVGKYPLSGKFTPDGRFYITTDMQWGPDVPGEFVEPPQGQLSVVKLDTMPQGGSEPRHEVVAASPVGINPEGLAISPDGSMVVTANLVRSFLPNNDPRQTRGSISLLTFDRGTGQLTPVEEYSIDSMPLGLAFDAKGRFVVVTQFHSFNPKVTTGELAFFRVFEKGERLPKNYAAAGDAASGSAEQSAEKRTRGPGLVQADFFVGVGKGPHGILIVR
jgi:DNA-binding beta-propeller fold protein YncE